MIIYQGHLFLALGEVTFVLPFYSIDSAWSNTAIKRYWYGTRILKIYSNTIKKKNFV
jgi:hypothetical protein